MPDRLIVAALVLASLSCTNVALQPLAVNENGLDDRVALRGEVCTQPPDPSAFPVKIVFLIDKSGSMCVSDPPGAQSNNGFCEMFPGNGDQPGRVRALHSVLQRLQQSQQDQQTPNVFVSLDPFESRIVDAYPVTTDSGPLFVSASEPSLPGRIDALQTNLGKGTDYQGALAQAYWRIESDIKRTNRQELPRTKYVVILLTDGSPYPRCALNDGMPLADYANATEPWRIWKDNPVDFCNASDAGDEVEGFIGGTERNQNHQIFDAVDRLMALRDKYNVGEIRVHTMLLFNMQAVEACGALCRTDLFNGLYPEEARTAATWTLRQIAEVHGEGTFQEFTTAASIELGSLDYSSLASRFAVKTLLARNTSFFPGAQGPEIDSDGDGLGDSTDAVQSAGTNLFSVDTDQDGFSDGFEYLHRPEGFDPLVPDPRGCRDYDGNTAPHNCLDTDSDGLSQAAEAYLLTDETIPDTDTDGIPDGAEAMAGLDPTVRNERVHDADLDSVPDITEVIAHTNPMADDRSAHAEESYRYDVTRREMDDGRVCYDFVVSNVRLARTDRASGQIGYNYITLTFGQAPEASVPRDYGLWKQACVFAQFAPPSVRVPAGPEIYLEDRDFIRLGDTRWQTPVGSTLPTAATDNREICGDFHP